MPPGGYGPPYGQPAFGVPHKAPKGGRIMARLLVGLVPALAIAGFVTWRLLSAGIGGAGSGKGDAARELERAGIEAEAANPNEIIGAMHKRAKKWRKDAEFYAVSINGLKKDGTVDFTASSSTMIVEFFSPKLVSSASKADRDKSIRKFVISKHKLDEQIWGVNKRYDDVPGTPIPKCKATKLGKLLADKGLKGDDTALVSLDPQFAFATDGLSFNVNVTQPKLHLYVDIHSCEILKEL